MKISLAISSILFLFTAELSLSAMPQQYQVDLEDSKKDKITGTLLAQGNSKRRSRKKILTGEARSGATKTEIDFDAASIDGERRAPVGVAIGSNKQNNGYDLINLRLRWHPEMIKSTSNLETGKGQ